MKVPITVRFLGGAQHTVGLDRVQVELDDRLEGLLAELNQLFGAQLKGDIGTEYLVTINQTALEQHQRRTGDLMPGDVVAVIAPFVGG